MTNSVSAAPRWLTPTTSEERERGDGWRVAAFIESYCRTTKDTIAGYAGDLITLRGWQRGLLDGLFARRADGRLKHRTALIGMPRKNGKSALGSGIGLYGLFLGPHGAEVYSCAADKDQARIVFGVAKRIVELDPELSAEAKLYRDAIEIPSTGSVYRVLSSEAFTKEGLNPTLVVYDELHAAPNDELWHTMTLGSGARIDPLVVAITTAGVRTDTTGQDSVCYRLYQYGRKVASGEIDDPSFFFAWWEADEGSDPSDPETWAAANPGLGDILDPEDLASQIPPKTLESQFRIKRLNQWVASETHWLPHGAWERLYEEREVPDGAEVVLGFDGSYNRDSTALVGWWLGDVPHCFVLGVWERPEDALPDWTVPREEVEARVVEAFERYRVKQLRMDTSKWPDETRRWSERFGDVVLEYPNTPHRMVPACAALYGAVVEGRITHDGNPVLTRHLRNAVVKERPDGAYITKDGRGSPRKIDAAIAAIIGFTGVVEGRESVTPFFALS